MNKEKCVSARFAVDLEQLEAVRHFVKWVCQSVPGDFDKFSFELQLVINELFCNIVEHGYRHLPKGEITLDCRVVENGIYMTVSDQGHVFDPSKLKPPDLHSTQERGYGLFLVRQMVEEMSYTPKTPIEEWNRLRIFKRYLLKGKHEISLLGQVGENHV